MSKLKSLVVNGFVFFIVVVLYTVSPAHGGQKDYIGLEYGPVGCSGVTTLFGGKQFNELLAGRWSTAVDSSSCMRNDKRVIIESLYSAGMVLRLPLTGSFYVKGGVNYAVLGRVNDSSFSGLSYNVGFDYQYLEALGFTFTFGKLGDINTMNAGVTITY